MQSTWQLVGMVLASALFWMQYVDLKDRLRPEPRKLLLIAFLLGIVAWLMALLFFTACDVFGLPEPHSGGKWWTAAYCLLLIGPVEEGAKILLAYLFVFGWREFDEPIDGFVYAAAISLGFASVENSCNLPDLPFAEQLARTAALPLTHTLFGAVWGFGIARARLRMAPGLRRTLWQAASAALGMELHGLYDFLLFAYNATLLTSALMLIVWVFVIWHARVLVKQPRLVALKTENCAARRHLMKD
jgi:protease PrsW